MGLGRRRADPRRVRGGVPGAVPERHHRPPLLRRGHPRDARWTSTASWRDCPTGPGLGVRAVGGDHPEPVVGSHDRRRPHPHAQPPRRASRTTEQVVNTAWRPDRPVEASTTWADHDAAAARGGRRRRARVQHRDAHRGWRGRGRGPGPGERFDRGVRARPTRAAASASARSTRSTRAPWTSSSARASTSGCGASSSGPTTRTSSRSANLRSGSTATPSSTAGPSCSTRARRPSGRRRCATRIPLVMDEIAIAFPELRIVMAHLGHPWQADTIAVIRKHPHVYADVSRGLLPAVVVLLRDAPRDRVGRAAQAAVRLGLPRRHAAGDDRRARGA